LGILDKILNRQSEISWMYDLELFQETSEKTYLKRMVLDTCIEFLARTISQSEFRITNTERKVVKDSIWYKLNVRPNTDLSSTDFWQKVIYKLIYDNEVLIVVSDTRDLLIADSYQRKKYTLYPDIFEHVMIDEYEFERSFNMDEVIYLTYDNNKITDFVNDLFKDYGELFGRMLDAQMRNYQIRGILNVDSQKVGTQAETEKMQNFVKKLTQSFRKNGVAISPLTRGFEYQDLSSSGKTSNAPYDDLSKLHKSLLDFVARAIGIPPSLINGDMADLKNALESYSKFCMKPLNKKIEDELKAKLLKQSDVIKGWDLRVIGIDKKNPLELADSIDKLVSSSTFTPNEVLILLGEETSDDPEMDKHLVTKNYQKAHEQDNEDDDSFKGGDDE